MPSFAEPRLTPVRATPPAGVASRSRVTSRSSQSAPAAARRHRGTAERRLRERHMRLLRRDLLVDVVLALVVTVVMLIVTAGLGVIALIELLVGAALMGSFVAKRWWRRRSPGAHHRRPGVAPKRRR